MEPHSGKPPPEDGYAAGASAAYAPVCGVGGVPASEGKKEESGEAF